MKSCALTFSSVGCLTFSPLSLSLRICMWLPALTGDREPFSADIARDASSFIRLQPKTSRLLRQDSRKARCLGLENTLNMGLSFAVCRFRRAHTTPKAWLRDLCRRHIDFVQ